MPAIPGSSYRPPILMGNGHLQTIFPSVFRKVRGVSYIRQRLWTADGDFVDLDWSTVGARRAVLIAHGLEGSSGRSYVLGMVKALNRRGWDAAVWNFRGCSGEPNRRPRFYHSGDTQDLDLVLRSITDARHYDGLAMVGFSLGGNVILKYLGERAERVDQAIRAVVAFSVPCDLASGAVKMALPSNALYMKRFLRMLHQKVRDKMELLPGEIDDADFHLMRTFKDFDERYTAPLHGFESAEDYWRRSSSRPLLRRIAIPSLLVNALNDPFLGPECYPREEARLSDRFFLETPASGGHVGFVSCNHDGEYWSERRAADFLEHFR
jgi:uncharacterized protein